MPKTIIVGAGISGLMAATTLTQNGWDVEVVDKGRGVGGRTATRRFDDAKFDHGAQFFTVRDPQFATWVEKWQAAGIVEVWSHGFAKPNESYIPDGHARYHALPSMTGIAKQLAKDLQVHTSTQIQSITHDDTQWHLLAENGVNFTGDALILTAPVPQSLALLATGNITLPTDAHQALTAIEYHPSFAVMVITDTPSNIPEPGAVQIQGEPIAWIADNRQKGVSPDATAITIHSGPDFTRQHLNADRQVIGQMLIDAASEWIAGTVLSFQVHRWLYSQPIQSYTERALLTHAPLPIVFAGDAFGEPRIEGAALSGLEAGKILSNLG